MAPVDGALGPAVALLSRAPERGRSKTRLARGIGADAAARLAAALLLDAAAALRSAPAWHPALFVEPPAAVAELAARTGISDARPQARGSIGPRMRHAARALFRDGYAPVVLVGSDIPALSARHLQEAGAALGEADVVFGPAADGGYYLIGLRTEQPTLFDEAIPWSSPQVLAASERRARGAGLRSARIAPEHDLDTLADLTTLRRRRRDLARRGVAQHTLAALSTIEERSNRTAP